MNDRSELCGSVFETALQMVAPLRNVTPCPEKEEQTERREQKDQPGGPRRGVPQETACKTQRNEARSDDIMC